MNSNYTAHQMGRCAKRQPIMGIFNGGGKMIRTLDTSSLCTLYTNYRTYLKTLRDITKAATLEEAQELAKLALQGDTENADTN